MILPCAFIVNATMAYMWGLSFQDSVIMQVDQLDVPHGGVVLKEYIEAVHRLCWFPQNHPFVYISTSEIIPNFKY